MENDLKKRIMRRVYAVWFVRKAAPLAAEGAGLLVLFVWGLRYVSPANIMVNAISAADGLYAFFMFFVRNFQNLPAASQFALAASVILAIVIARDMWIQGGRLFSVREKIALVS